MIAFSKHLATFVGFDTAPAKPIAGRLSKNAEVSCCRFRGHEDKIVTKELESGYDETEVYA